MLAAFAAGDPAMDRLIARRLRRAAPPDAAADRVTLDYEARFLRRRSLVTDAGRTLLVDLPETVSLEDGDALETDDGALVAVRAAPEPLIEATAPADDLARLAWHVGNRHAPAQIEPRRLLIRADPVLADLLARLGAATRPVTEPFRPEGGAYGLGRTHGHHHGGPTDHPHAHAHD
jgi:urease accessory protein